MIRRFLAATAGLVMLAAVVPAAEAASCSSWRATCQTRGGGSDCDAKFAKCMKTGTWTEGQKWGGGTHTGLTRK